MKTAAPDFRVFWDNAYAVHHLTEERVEIANILDLCARHGHPNRAFVFASTSKITLPGSGLALFAASKDNVQWLLARLTPRTIGPDKLNQLRHVRFLKDEAAILRLMDRHRAVIAPKFQKVLDIFDEKLAQVPDVSWTRPKGGYFISLEVGQGLCQAGSGAWQRKPASCLPRLERRILTEKTLRTGRSALLPRSLLWRRLLWRRRGWRSAFCSRLPRRPGGRRIRASDS